MSEVLPAAEVSQSGSLVKISVVDKWEFTAAPDTVFSAHPYFIAAEDKKGKPPLFDTFGSLLGLNGGLLTLKEGDRYRIAVADVRAPAPAPAPTTRAEKPSSPPRNGIGRADVTIPRRTLVEKILQAKPIVIIRSPPATGKTSLLELTEAALIKRDRTKVVRLDLVGGESSDELLSLLRDLLEVKKKLPAGFRELPDQLDTWILIDDAQLGFSAEPFWRAVIKNVESLPRSHLHVVIAATYDLQSQGSTPIVFREYAHVQDLRLSAEEANQLYDGYVGGLSFAFGWEAFKDRLLRFSNGHVGVLTGGIALLHQEHSNSEKRLTQDGALRALHGDKFKGCIERCFPRQTLMNDEQRECIANTICQGAGRTGTLIDTSIGEDVRARLVRSGILSTDGTFSCLIAQEQYYNYYFRRPVDGPSTVEDLTRQSVKSMSALRLQQSSIDREFPKEAAFQQLFNEAMTLQLPPRVAVCPELNSFAKSTSGEVQTGELDFLIDGRDEFKWAVELLVNGDKINEHVSRFDPRNGKYRMVGYTEYIVIDCRKAMRRNVQTMPHRCTLYFDDDFRKVQCRMGNAQIETLDLLD